MKASVSLTLLGKKKCPKLVLIFHLLYVTTTILHVCQGAKDYNKPGDNEGGDDIPSGLFRNFIDHGMPYVVVAPSAFINDDDKRNVEDYNSDDYYIEDGFGGGSDLVPGGAISRQQVKRFRFYGPDYPFRNIAANNFRQALHKRYHGGDRKRFVDRYRMAFGIGRKRKRRDLVVIDDMSKRNYKGGSVSPKARLMPYYMYLGATSNKNSGQQQERSAAKKSLYSSSSSSLRSTNPNFPGYNSQAATRDNNVGTGYGYQLGYPWNVNSIPDRYKKRIDKYRMFFGLG